MTLSNGIALGVLLAGVVSIEGLLIGTAAAGLIAIIIIIGHGWNGRIFLIIVLSGTFGNGVDSVLGAAFERKGRLSNNWVNFLNTLAAGLLAGLLETMWIPRPNLLSVRVL